MRLELGQLSKSRAGRDSGRIYVVVKIIDDRFVEVADGIRRTVAKPKKKNVNHLVAMNATAHEIRRRLLNMEEVTDEEIRGILKTLARECDKEGR